MVITLYDETERPKVDFVGYATENERFDLAIIHTNHFFGKPLVVCLQSGKSTLLDLQDLHFVDYLKTTFSFKSDVDATEVAEFLKTRLTALPTYTQY